MCKNFNVKGIVLKIPIIIRNNLIGDLPPELAQCSKLRDIVLSFNTFQKLPEVIYSLKSIETIVANDNQVRFIYDCMLLGFCLCIATIILLLCFQISSIDVDGLLQLPHLGCLDLQNNNISQVPPRLGTVATLKYVGILAESYKYDDEAPHFHYAVVDFVFCFCIL